jgi:hypothetical protein
VIDPLVHPLQQLACNGQPGVIKPGFERLVYVASPAVAELLIGLATDGAGAVLIAAFLGGKTYDLLNICTQPDPGDPGMTLDDWADAIDYANAGRQIPAARKAAQWFVHVMWPTWCDCANGTSPPPNTTTPPPNGSGNPGLQPGPLGGGCWTHSDTRTSTDPNNPINWNDILPDIPPTNPATQGNQVGIQTPIPSTISVTATIGSEGDNAASMSWNINFFNTGGTAIAGSGNGIAQMPPGTTRTLNVPVPPTAANWHLSSSSGVGGGDTLTNSVGMSVTIYCQGQSPTSTTSPCCPPDPATDQRLGAIMDMLTQLLSLQSLAGPYQETVHHNGLTGQGTISINPASTAIRFDVTSDLSSWPHNPQTPNYYYSLGFVTPFAVGTPLRGQRLIYNHQTFSWPSYTDQIGFTFPLGITANLVELTQGAT